MIDKAAEQQIITIWDNYIKTDKKVLDTKGKELPNIDELRIVAIEQLKMLINQFLQNEIDIREFKTAIDSFNKRNNLWGFTATKGQMFFNQLVRNSENTIDKLTKLLQQTITEPKDLNEGLSKIEKLEKFCATIYSKAKDKRKVPKPSSVGYFLSYFWQIFNNQKWAIFYTSQVNAFIELNIWDEKPNQKENYENFYNLNEQVKSILSKHTGKTISNWEAEHALWNFKGNPNKTEIVKEEIKPIETKSEPVLSRSASFELTDYLIPRVAKLIELGAETDKSASAKGSQFEKMVAEIFHQLDFEVDLLGQGSGRNPDAIIKLREENTAFIVDAKAYSNGYSLGVDDRAIKEYINYYCPKLLKEGYKKIGFIIVSNSFKSNFDSFINEVTWNTDIKRFILLSSEALLYLLAYKTKDKLSLSNMIESIIGFSNPVTANEVIAEFDDV